MKTSIIIRLPNWVGDVIMCLPAIKKLQELEISFILFGKPWIHDLLKSLNIPMATCPHSKIAAIKVLKNLPAENVLLFTNSFSSAFIAWAAGKKTYGYSQDKRSFFLSHALTKPLNLHEIDKFNLLTASMLTQWFPHQAITSFANTPQLKITDVTETLVRYKIKQPYIVLCPFAHGQSPEGHSKKWPHWQALTTQLKHLPFIICPGPNEISEAEKCFPTICRFNHLTLQEYLIILSQAKLIIANDSGPLHMACATNRPTIALFGTTDEKRTAPRNAIIMGSLGTWPSLESVIHQINTQLAQG